MDRDVSATRNILGIIMTSFCGMLPSSLLAGEACPELPDSELSAHMLYIDEHGNLLNPLTRKQVINETTYVQHILNHFDEARQQAGLPSHITIFIHGGLNTWEKAIDRPRTRTTCMMAAGTYPIFIGWSSNPTGNYWDHLARLRRGSRWSWPMGVATAPFVLLEDIARSVVRTLPALSKEVREPFLNVANQLSRPELSSAMKSADKQALGALNQRLSLHTSGEGVLDSYWSVGNPAKLLTAPLTDGLGTGIWQSLLRRTDFVLDRSADYENSTPTDPADPDHANTAATYFLNKLEQQQATTISLVGHSMGTLVATNILARHPGLKIQHVVFMGAAAPLKSLESVVAPWLIKNPSASFYNLSLDPDLEVSERNFGDLLPRGSLLNWIDGIFASVNSFKDRTAGDWSNIAQTAAEIFGSGCNGKMGTVCVAQQVHLTRFGVGADRGPQKHGDFDEYCFWQKEYWEPAENSVIRRFPDCAPLAKSARGDR